MDNSQPAVLVVEDDPDIAIILQQILEAADIVVEHTADGLAALARIESGEIDLVLLDLMLPGINGLDLCRRVRASAREVYLPIIMVTALSSEQQRLAGFEAGADDYVGKPFAVDEVLARVQVWLRTRQRLQAAHDQLVRQQEALRDAERREYAARLEGVTVTARELAHRVNNHLQGVIAVCGLLSVDARIPADLQALTAEAQDYADAAAAVIIQLQQVVRVTTRETPMGPALDLDRSTEPPSPADPQGSLGA
jgi:DNA-binding response OmpR family regulator